MFVKGLYHRTERKVRWMCDFGQQSVVAKSGGGERDQVAGSETSEAVVAGLSAPGLWPLRWAGWVVGHSVLQGGWGAVAAACLKFQRDHLLVFLCCLRHL